MKFTGYCNQCNGAKNATNVNIRAGGIMEVGLECGHWTYFDTAKYITDGKHLGYDEMIGLPVELRKITAEAHKISLEDEKR